MIGFAVQVDGEDRGHWVLAVQEGHVLISDDEQKLRWIPMSSCKVIKVSNPDMAYPVYVVQPQAAAPKLTVPQVAMPNGAKVRR